FQSASSQMRRHAVKLYVRGVRGEGTHHYICYSARGGGASRGGAHGGGAPCRGARGRGGGDRGSGVRGEGADYIFPSSSSEVHSSEDLESTVASTIPWDISENPVTYSLNFKYFFLQSMCIRCRCNFATFFCCNCRVQFCSDCKELSHGQFLPHRFLEWNGNLFSTEAAPTRPKMTCCSESTVAGHTFAISLIDEHGEISADFALCANCSTDSLLKQGYFPISKQDPVSFVDIRLLELIDSLMCEGTLSLWKALRTILLSGTFSRAQLTNFNNLYQSFYRHGTMQRYRQLILDVTFWPTNCMLCPNSECTERPTILAADGIFGLRRKSSAGNKQDVLPSNGVLPAPFVHVPENRSTDASSNQTNDACSNFHAGDLVRGGRAGLDIHGFFAISCRHNFIGACADIRSNGERLAYAEYCLKYYLRNQPAARNLIFIYDVACKIGSRLQAIAEDSTSTERITPAVNAFHAYGHQTKCQLRHSVRVVEGCGLTDGEHCERINALLRPYGPQLKEMRLDRRTFFLAYVIRHLNATQLLNTADWLNCRLRLHKKHSDALSTELKELLVSVPQASDVAVLIELGKQFLSEDRLASNRPASALERLRSYATESQFLLRKMRTAYGQRDCQLIVRRLEKLRIKIRRSIGSLPPTQRAPMKDFLDPEGEVFISCGQSQSGLDCLLRKRIIDASSRSDRLKEEGVMLRQEVHDLQHRLIQAESQFRDAQGLDAQFRMMFIELLRKVETVQRTLHAPNTFDEYIDLAREDQSSTSSSLGDLEDEEGSESD
ncbi:hypothetical protein BOX15_Mlig007768g1, partial [Macrostomum lignano]